MTWIIALFTRWGISEPLRKTAAWSVVGLAGLAALALLKGCYDHHVIARHEAKVELRAASARAKAETERAADAATDTRSEKELHDAIDTAPAGGTLSPAAHALACQRLLRAGIAAPACRPAGGHRGQAGA